MINKEALIKYIKNDQHHQIAVKTLNKAEYVLKHYSIGYTDFYDPYQISICISILDQIIGVHYWVEGGIENAERKILIIYPEYMAVDAIDKPICALKITGKFKEGELSHRDVLGSILGLGLKREKIGDIYVGNGYAYIIAYKEMCEYIRLYLNKISRHNVNVEDISLEEVTRPEERYKLIYTTVPSLRLDVITSVGFGESRGAISKVIHNNKIKVNWKPVNQASYMIKQGDVISFRGKGRISLEQIKGKSKKNRYKIVIRRMI